MKHAYLAGSVLALAMAAVVPRPVQAAEANLDCKLKFSLTGWSLIYKRAEGSGVITCENGKSVPVKITANGGGLTVGKTKIENGTGKFTDVHKIEDTLGTYAQGDASIAAGKAGTAQVMTKGKVSLALAGAGEGVDIGVSFGGFTIERAK